MIREATDARHYLDVLVRAHARKLKRKAEWVREIRDAQYAVEALCAEMERLTAECESQGERIDELDEQVAEADAEYAKCDAERLRLEAQVAKLIEARKGTT
jgi:hypothetical protein